MNTKQFVIGKLLITAVVAFALHSALYAGGPKWAHVTPVKESKALNVYIQLPVEERFTMSVYSEESGTLWSRKYSDDTVEQSILVDAFPEGVYRFTVESDRSRIQYPFSIKDGEIAVHYQEAVETTMPEVQIVGGGFEVDYTSAKASTSVMIRILDKQGNVIFRQRLSPVERKKVQYDLTQTPNGRYTLQFQIDGDAWFSRKMSLTSGYVELY